MTQYTFTQDTVSKAVTDFLHYTWIFEEAGEGEQKTKILGKILAKRLAP